MSFLTDLIKEKASEVLADKISIPEGIQEQVLGGIADSIFGSVKQTAGKEGGMDQLIELFTGREKATSSPVTQLASSIFGSDIAKKLGFPGKSIEVGCHFLQGIFLTQESNPCFLQSRQILYLSHQESLGHSLNSPIFLTAFTCVNFPESPWLLFQALDSLVYVSIFVALGVVCPGCESVVFL